MDDNLQLFGQMPAFTESSGSSKQVFGVMDEISANFQDELHQAQQGLSPKKAKKASKPEKLISSEKNDEIQKKPKEEIKGNRVDKKEEIDSNQSTGKYERTEHVKEGKAKEINEDQPVDQDKKIEEEIPEESAVEEIEITEEDVSLDAEDLNIEDTGLLEEEIEIVDEEIIIEDTDLSLIDENLIEESAEEVSEEVVVDTTEEVETVDLNESNVEVDDVSLEEQVAVTGNPDEIIDEAPIEEEELLSDIPKINVKKKALGEIKAQTISKKDTEELPEDIDDSLLDELSLKENSGKTISQEKVQTKVETTQISNLDKEIITEEEDFTPLSDSVLKSLDSKELEKALDLLQKLAAQTQVQTHAPEKISNRMMDAIKEMNRPLAKQIESIRSQNNSQPQIKQPSEKLDDSQKTSMAKEKELHFKYQDPRLEKLKSRIVDQVRFQLKMAIKGKIGEMRLNLKPQFLGQVKIKMTIEDSIMKAHFIVDNQSVKDMMEKSLPQLEDSLRDKGIDANEIFVDLAEGGSEEQKNQGGNGFASLENQKIAKQWLGTFHTMGLLRNEELENAPEVIQEGESDEVLDILA